MEDPHPLDQHAENLKTTRGPHPPGSAALGAVKAPQNPAATARSQRLIRRAAGQHWGNRTSVNDRLLPATSN